MAGILFLLVTFLGIAMTVAFASHTRLHAVLWAAVATALPCTVVGLVMLTSETTVTLDGSANRVVIARRLLWFTSVRSELNLADLNSAEVIDGTGRQKGLHYLCLLLQSGERVSLGHYSSQTGHYEAAIAINEFIKNQPHQR